MNKSKFDEIVANKANVLVQSALGTFTAEVTKALQQMYTTLEVEQQSDFANRGSTTLWLGGRNCELSKKVLRALVASERIPLDLWGYAAAKVAADLLSTMDVMQQALAAPPPAETDVFKPEEPADGKS